MSRALMAEPTLKAYNPTWRDKLGGLLMGDGRASPERRNFVQGLLGSSGLGSTGAGLLDFTPAGIPLAAQESRRDAENGNWLGAATSAMAMVPAAKPAGMVAKGVGRELAMDEASRLSRAKSLGYNIDAYHGTSEPITAFDPSRLGETTGAGSANKAFFAASNPAVAEDYAYLAGNGPLASTSRELASLEDKARTGAQFSGAEMKRAEELYNHRDALEQSVKFTDDPAARFEGANVMPLRLKMENPLVHDFAGQPYRETSYSELIDRAKAAGNDGVVMRNTYDPAFPTERRLPTDVYAVFNPENIRSRFAAFDPSKMDSKDLLASLAALGIGGAMMPGQGNE